MDRGPRLQLRFTTEPRFTAEPRVMTEQRSRASQPNSVLCRGEPVLGLAMFLGTQFVLLRGQPGEDGI